MGMGNVSMVHNCYLAKDACSMPVHKFERTPKAGDRIGLKVDMSLNKVWLYFNGNLVTLLFENIPDFIIQAISNGDSRKYGGTYEVRLGQF